MITINIRKQGGAAVMTIPSNILKILGIGIGSTLELDITKDGFTAHPVTHKRYTLSELLDGTTPENIRSLNEATKWSREGEATGRELT